MVSSRLRPRIGQKSDLAWSKRRIRRSPVLSKTKEPLLEWLFQTE